MILPQGPGFRQRTARSPSTQGVARWPQVLVADATNLLYLTTRGSTTHQSLTYTPAGSSQPSVYRFWESNAPQPCSGSPRRPSGAPGETRNVTQDTVARASIPRSPAAEAGTSYQHARASVFGACLEALRALAGSDFAIAVFDNLQASPLPSLLASR